MRWQGRWRPWTLHVTLQICESPASKPAAGIRVALYVRLSPKPEGLVGDNYSIESQLHEGREKSLREYGCADPEVFIDKTSGKDLNRPEMDRLRDGIRKRIYDVVIARHQDRWTRDPIDIHLTVRELIKAECKLVFVSGPPIEDSPAGEFTYTVLAAAGQLERRMLADRSRRCRAQKAREGFAQAGPSAYGYQYKGHKFGVRGGYEVYEPEAQIVRRIYADLIAGKSRRQVALALNAEGVPTGKAGKGRLVGGVRQEFQGFWSGSRITQMITKTMYYGERTEMGQTITVPAIMSKADWDKAQTAGASNRVSGVGRPSGRFLLAGKIWCARCNQRCGCQSTSGGRYPYYGCRAIEPKAGQRVCFGTSAPAPKVEEITWRALWETLTQPRLLTKVITDYHKVLITVPKAKKDAAAKRQDGARMAVTHFEKIMRDPFSPIDYDTRRSDLDNARRELAAAESAVPSATVFQMPSPKAIEALCKEFSECAGLKDFENRRGIIERAIDRIMFDGQKIVIHAFVEVASGGNRSQRVGDTDGGRESRLGLSAHPG